MLTIIPVLIGGLALVFAALAWWNTRERFRLDLFEKRWLVYESIIEVVGKIFAYGGVPDPRDEKTQPEFWELMDAAKRSIRGPGYHRVRALFGPDVEKECDALNKQLAWMESFGLYSDRGDEWRERILELEKISTRLVKTFEPYMYFGQYKNWLPGPENREFKYD